MYPKQQTFLVLGLSRSGTAVTEFLLKKQARVYIYDDVSGGASNDIMRATQIARNMVTKYGMSDELGTIQFGSEHGSDEVFLGRDFNSQRDYSEATAAKIDAEIKRIIDEAFARIQKKHSKFVITKLFEVSSTNPKWSVKQYDKLVAAYLNEYHQWVFEQLSGYFSGEELEFLKEACAAL
jgi:hypothetical protein